MKDPHGCTLSKGVSPSAAEKATRKNVIRGNVACLEE
jgi:hypothetical protein